MYARSFDESEIFMVFFAIIAVTVIGIIAYSIIKGISQWSYNNSQPVLSVDAVVKAKRTQVSGGGGETSSSTYYYITFEFESKDRSEYQVKSNEFGLIAEGDSGKLTFQGTRFLGFERAK